MASQVYAAGANVDTIQATTLLSKFMTQSNTGTLMNIQLTTPLQLAAPFAPGGTATSMNLSLIPVGASPHTAVNLRLNFYNSVGALIGVQDIS